MTFPVKHISISINYPYLKSYEFVANPENLPLWAKGLSRSTLEKSGEEWISDSPMGKVKVKFVKLNPFGIIDHDVTLPNGDVVHNPLRVIKNGDGSEVVFTLFQLPNKSDNEFENDSKLVENDLKKLKQLLENKFK